MMCWHGHKQGDGMGLEQLGQSVIEFRDERHWEKFHTPENLAKSISIEAAELPEHFLWGGQVDSEGGR